MLSSPIGFTNRRRSTEAVKQISIRPLMEFNVVIALLIDDHGSKLFNSIDCNNEKCRQQVFIA